jgi:molybdopterin molybdotransferase
MSGRSSIVMSEPDVSNLMMVQQAMAIIDATIVRSRVMRMNLSESLGSFLAEDLHSDRDVPPFDKSLMDGYAVRAADIQTIPCELVVVGSVAAGESATAALQAGQAMGIMTGAPMPAGADAVVPVEATKSVRGSNRVMILENAARGSVPLRLRWRLVSAR